MRRTLRQKREEAVARLVERHVTVTVLPRGIQLVVRYCDTVADFWPGSGKYQMRGSRHIKNGLVKLLADLGVLHD